MQVFEFLTQMHPEKLNFDLVLPHYAQIWAYDVTTVGQILEIFEKLIHLWIPHRKITQNGSF